MLPLVIMGAAALQMYGQYSANQSQAAAEEKNARFFAKQAEHARVASKREQSIYLNESEIQMADQVTKFGKAGVDLSGSALAVLGDLKSNQLGEMSAIKREGDLRVELAAARSMESSDNAGTLRSVKYNLLQAGGTFLTAGSKAYGS